MQLLLGLLALLAILIAAGLLTVVGIVLVRRGSRQYGSQSLGLAMQELEALFMESKRHVIHEVRAEEGEEDVHAGDPPAK